MEVYTGFGKKSCKDYVCKSEINNSMLKELCVYGLVSVKEVKETFDEINDDRFCIIVLTGNSLNKNQQRHTKFIHKYALYKAVVKGLPKSR